jgi:hypothetical protein
MLRIAAIVVLASVLVVTGMKLSDARAQLHNERATANVVSYCLFEYDGSARTCVNNSLDVIGTYEGR